MTINKAGVEAAYAAVEALHGATIARALLAAEKRGAERGRGEGKSPTERESEIARDYEIGNLTSLGVISYLRHARFNLSYATERANFLAAIRRGEG